MVARFAANDLAVEAEHFLFDRCQIFLAVPEVIARRAALLQVAAARAPVVAAEHRYEEEPAKAELNLEADPVLRGIYESGRRPIRVASVGQV